MRRHLHRRQHLAAALLLCTLAISSAVVLLGATSPPDAASQSRPRPFAVYLQPDSVAPDSQLDIPAIETTLGDLPFITVTSAADLVATVDATQPFSIWFHRAALTDIPRDWIGTYRRQGTTIVGIDMSSAEFSSVVPTGMGSQTWDPPQVITYVMYSYRNLTEDVHGVTSSGSSWTNHYIRDIHRPYPFVAFTAQFIRSSLQHLLTVPNADLSDIPPALMPEPPEPMTPPTPGPQFPPEQEALAAEIALSDPRIVAAFGDHPHHVDVVRGSLNDDGTPRGASVEIRLDDAPQQITGDWVVQSAPTCVITDLRDPIRITFRATYISLWGIRVNVDLTTEEVTDIMAGHTTTSGDPWLDPPVFTGEHQQLPCSDP